MSAFQVWGVSRHELYEKAKKDTDWKGGWSEAQWLAAVNAHADELFGRAKPKAMSPRYDSPRFAEAYIKQAASDPAIRDLQVYALTPTGAIDPETKLDVLKWMPYTPGINAKQVA